MKSLKQIFFSTVLVFLSALLSAQFPPAAGLPGSTAIPADSPVFQAWAAGCIVDRGPQDLSMQELGKAETGMPEDAIGPADGLKVLSLGDGGTATLTFERPIRNGEGWDFAVFENSFSAEFLELAFVEVSSDGVHFFRFPAVSLTQTEEQIGAFALLETEQIDQLAGKYQAGWGTPFDLQQLEENPLLNRNVITHIRITDVVGSLLPEYGSVDSRNNYINDPWPTPFPSSGFDLDAVGVIHQALPAGGELTLFPNPLSPGQALKLAFSTSQRNLSINLYDSAGKLIQQFEPSGAVSFLQYNLPFELYPPGSYFIHIENDQLSETRQLILLP